MSNTVVSLAKGGVVNLSKHTPGLSSLTVGLGWTPASENNANNAGTEKKGFFSKLFGGSSSTESRSSEEYDLDAFVILLENGKCKDPKDGVIYFGHKSHSSGCVKHHGDNLVGGGKGDDEQVSIELSKVPSNCDQLVVAVNIYRAIDKNQSFGDITKAFIRLVDNKTNQEVCRYDISKDSDYKNSTALIMGHLKRVGSEWEFKAVGEGYRVASISDLVAKF